MAGLGASDLFFRSGEVKCPIYQRTRDLPELHHILGKSNLERLWERAAPYVDKGARDKARDDMPPVWWELYLAEAFLRLGKKPVPRIQRSPRNKGPDLLVGDPLGDNRRVWVEAVMPKGDEALALQTPGKAYDIPDAAYLLRLTSAVKVKAEQFSKYRERGFVKDGDAKVIAVSAARLNYRFNDLPTPRIVSAVFPAGHLTLMINRQTSKVTSEFLAYRDSILNLKGAPVQTDVFLRSEYARISAVLHSPCDWISPGDAGLILIHNPLATVPLRKGWLEVGREFWLENSTLRTVSHPTSSDRRA